MVLLSLMITLGISWMREQTGNDWSIAGKTGHSSSSGN